METMKSVIIGSLIALLGTILLAIICYAINWKSGLFMFPVFLLIGGFIATYLSNKRSAINGLYVGAVLLLSLSILMAIFRTKYPFIEFIIAGIIILLPLGFIGGLIAKYLNKM